MGEIAIQRAPFRRLLEHIQIGGDHGSPCGLRDPISPPCGPTRDQDAGDQALEIPLPWRPSRLIKFVEIEGKAALRGGIEAEIGYVGIATRGHLDPTRRAACQISSHDRRRTAIEGEWAGPHPLSTQREQVRQTRPLLIGQQVKRRPPIGVDCGQRRQSTSISIGPATGPPFPTRKWLSSGHLRPLFDWD